MTMRSAFYQRDSVIYFFAIAASMLLSLWIDIRETVINPDAICYLQSAESIGKLGISGAMQLCGQAKWPLYSSLVYGLVQIGQFSYPATAYFLDGVFSLISVLVFILIVKELGGRGRILWFAAATILLSHEFNSTREYIIRDHGFWSFYLVSLLCLLRYFKKPTWLNAFAWGSSLLLATLFRIEGAIFLVALPFCCFFNRSYSIKQRIHFFFQLNLLALLLFAGLSIYLLLNPQHSIEKLGRVPEILAQIQNGLTLIFERYQNSKLGLAQYVLSSDSAHEAGLVLSLVILLWYGIQLVGNLSLAYALLFFYGLRQKALVLTQNTTWVLISYLLINVTVTLIFFLEHLFLSKRYLIALSLVCMLFVPFAFDKLISNAKNLRMRFTLTAIILLILFSGMGGIFDFGYSKAYIHDAGDWLAKNVPAKASLYANDYQLMYYSRHFGDSIFNKKRQFVHIDTIAQGRFKQYDYIALRVSKNQEAKLAAVLQEINLKPSAFFGNKRGDRVVIYKIKP